MQLELGNGIAIPHCQSDCVKEALFTLVKLDEPIEWGSLDDLPVNYIIMLAAPNSSDNVHLKNVIDTCYEFNG